MTDTKCVRLTDDRTGYGLDMFTIPEHYREYIRTVLIPRGLVKDRITKMAEDIYNDYKGEKLTVLCILKGAYQFTSSLVTNNLEVINNRSTKENAIKINTEFIRVKSYEDDRSTGKVRIMGGEHIKVTGENILIVEDLIDTGRTMHEFLIHLREQNPKSVKLVTLLAKRTPKTVKKIHLDYCGFEVPDEHVVGLGFDYNENFRDLKHICLMNDHAKKSLAIAKQPQNN